MTRTFRRPHYESQRSWWVRFTHAFGKYTQGWYPQDLRAPTKEEYWFYERYAHADRNRNHKNPPRDFRRWNKRAMNTQHKKEIRRWLADSDHPVQCFPWNRSKEYWD